MRQAAFLIFWRDVAISLLAPDKARFPQELHVMNRAAEAASEIADEFGFLDDWEDRYQLLIDLGRRLPPLPAQYANDEYRLRGCQSVCLLYTSPSPRD